jgi:outer membrane receptor protein involved in Fe transport
MNALLDPVALKLLALFPLPNIPGKQTNNFIRNAGLVDNNDTYGGRLDWNPRENDSVFGRYSYSNRFRFIPGNFGGIADGTSTSAWGRQNLSAHSAVVGWNHILTPTLMNELRVGYVRNASYAVQDPFGLNHTADYIPGVPLNPAVDGGVSQTSFSNFGFIGSPDFLPKFQVPQQLQYVDTVSLTRGNHSLKFGVDARYPMRNIFQDEPGTRGSLSFNGQFTGLSYADALVGYVQGAQLTNVFFVDQRLFMASAFTQDDWKVTPRLTFNLGLRYDFGSPGYEGRNRMGNFDPTANSGAGGLVFAKSGSLEDRALVKVNGHNLAPRFGFAYSADSKPSFAAATVFL